MFNPINLLVVASKYFRLTPDYVLGMSYWLLMAMLKDNNVMHERPEKEDKDAVKKGTGMDLANMMR